MVNISRNRQIRAPIEKIWGVVSDIDNDPRFFSGYISLRNITKNGNVIEREVIVEPFKHVNIQTVVLKPMESVEVRMTKGDLTGKRLTVLRTQGPDLTSVGLEWDVEIKAPSFVHRMVKAQIEKMTEEALDKIAIEVEPNKISRASKPASSSPTSFWNGR